MCCLVEKEIPLRGRQAYSWKIFDVDHPKRLTEKANEYHVKASSRVIYRKLAKGSTEYSIIKRRRPMLVSVPSRAADVGEREVTVLDFMRANRPKTIQILSAVISAAMLLSLASSVLFGVHIVNPVPALLILVTFIGFFLMAKSAERFDVDR